MERETWLNALLNKSSRSSSPDCIFYGVPKNLQKENTEAYTPQAVSIGPLHHDKSHLQPMQPKKVNYLKCFFDRTRADKVHFFTLAKDWEGFAREYYQGNSVKLTPDDFKKIILVDGIFVIEFLLRMCLHKVVEEWDEIFKTDLLRDDIFHDIIVLLENQLPFSVIKALYTSCNQIDIPWEEFLYVIAKEWFKKGVNFDKVKETLKIYDETRHLADFLHALCVVSITRETSYKRNIRQNIDLSRSAQELVEAGVRFEVTKDELPFDLKFDKDEGILKFPSLIIDRWTELSFRNLIAHEHCLHKDKIITSYIILLGSLLETSKDVDLLVEQGIIDNRSLSNSEDVCDLFKKLYDRSTMDKSEFYYTCLCERLNDYSKDYWHQWKAACYRWKEMLKNEYFNSPWTIISFVAAFILLVLSIIQTWCSVVAVRWDNN